MDLILDTCALLSLAGLARRKLSHETLVLIKGADRLTLSACGLFEISLKHKRGGLQLEPFDSAQSFWNQAVKSYACEVLPVEAVDFSNAVELPDHHADPFDRIILAQANRLNCPIVTYDRLFAAYGVKVIN